MNLKRAFKWAGAVAAGLVVLCILGVFSLIVALRGSLAQLDGRHPLAGLGAPVVIERDALGVPTIRATNRLDATRALGFLHAQDRFFQMDLSRRFGAGELSELFGRVALDADRKQRVHRPRARARKAFEQSQPADKALIQAYTEGVNAGLAAMRVRPPEYLALRLKPAPWQLEDMFLAGFAMFRQLHDIDGSADYSELVLRNALSPAAVAFFDSPDVDWSAAIDGSVPPRPPVPGPEDFTLASNDSHLSASRADGPRGRIPGIGSNNWAVDGRRSGTGAAIVANDMHLGLNVPNTWYRARLIYHDPEIGPQDVTGVTLPGTPVMPAGSNGHVVWGNTASCLDVSDLVILDFDPADPTRYRTPNGWRKLESLEETIPVRGGTNVVLTVDETIWGPVVMRGGTNYALACTMHEPGAVNAGLIEVEKAGDVETALRRANVAGTPVNNFVVGDRSGHIGYSLLGRLPKRIGFDGSVPVSWADGTCRWDGWVPPEQYPRYLNPTNGVLWTANSRVLGTPEYTTLHLSRPDNGARARQIRDDLLSMDSFSEQSLWAIYKDDRALFLDRWQKLMLSVLESGSATNAAWREAGTLVQSWGARAAVESVGYRLVRAFRSHTVELLMKPANDKLAKHEPGISLRSEDAAWTLIQTRPVHLLNSKFETYDALLASAVRGVLERTGSHNRHLTEMTWGQVNRLGIRHPLSSAVERLSRWLDMPDVPVPGDHNMPKVHLPGMGVSERMIVSPGREENALFNMPCGQSGHFLSPFYRSEMESWLKVEAKPFLPGPKAHELRLEP